MVRFWVGLGMWDARRWTSPYNRALLMLRNLFSRENLYAVLLCLVAIMLLIMTADASPLWIYQGF